VKPTHQLSRMSLLVPVFTALQTRVAIALSNPKVRARATRSDRMSPTMKAARASMTGTRFGVGSSARNRIGAARPPLASAR